MEVRAGVGYKRKKNKKKEKKQNKTKWTPRDCPLDVEKGHFLEQLRKQGVELYESQNHLQPGEIGNNIATI